MVVIGAGPAGVSCAENLRKEGFTGRIVMLTKEKAENTPVDRTGLSKNIGKVAGSMRKI